MPATLTCGFSTQSVIPISFAIGASISTNVSVRSHSRFLRSQIFRQFHAMYHKIRAFQKGADRHTLRRRRLRSLLMRCKKSLQFCHRLIKKRLRRDRYISVFFKYSFKLKSLQEKTVLASIANPSSGCSSFTTFFVCTPLCSISVLPLLLFLSIALYPVKVKHQHILIIEELDRIFHTHLPQLRLDLPVINFLRNTSYITGTYFPP